MQPPPPAGPGPGNHAVPGQADSSWQPPGARPGPRRPVLAAVVGSGVALVLGVGLIAAALVSGLGGSGAPAATATSTSSDPSPMSPPSMPSPSGDPSMPWPSPSAPSDGRSGPAPDGGPGRGPAAEVDAARIDECFDMFSFVSQPFDGEQASGMVYSDADLLDLTGCLADGNEVTETPDAYAWRTPGLVHEVGARVVDGRLVVRYTVHGNDAAPPTSGPLDA